MIIPIAGSGNKVIIKVIEEENKTKSGIFLGDAIPKTTQKATVIAVSEKDSAGITPVVKVGDTILLATGRFIAQEVEYKDEKLTIIRESDIIGVI